MLTFDLRLGNAFELIKKMENDSADLIITDPISIESTGKGNSSFSIFFTVAEKRLR